MLYWVRTMVMGYTKMYPVGLVMLGYLCVPYMSSLLVL